MPMKPKHETKISKWALFRNFMFGLSFILVASINDNPAKKTNRIPSSSNNIITSSFIKNPLIKYTKKLSAPMITQISSDTNRILEGETFTLTGNLKTTSQMKNIELKWLLPSDFTIVSGSSSSYITTAEPGQDYQFQITVKSSSTVNEIIHLVAKSQIGDSFYSNSSQFHTKLQTELNKSNLELFERTKKYLEANN